MGFNQVYHGQKGGIGELLWTIGSEVFFFSIQCLEDKKGSGMRLEMSLTKLLEDKSALNGVQNGFNNSCLG